MDNATHGNVEEVKDWDASHFKAGTMGREGVCTWGDDKGEAVATVVIVDRNGVRSTWAACESHRRSITKPL